MNKIYIYAIVMALVTYGIRALPLVLCKKEIKNRTVKSFLFYMPYVCLGAMTFPGIILATRSIISGIVALVVGVIVSLTSGNLFKVAILCCLSVFITELIIGL